MTKKAYNRKLVDLFDDYADEGEAPAFGRHYEESFGLELEIEGTRLPVEISDRSEFWRDEPDTSLRGESREYILKKPLNTEQIPLALEELKTIFQKNKATILDSMNTSAHVHLNCQNLTMRQVATIATTYYILENLLMEYCGQEREGNRFCLRLSDVDDVSKWLANTFRTDKYYKLRDDSYRYSALNWTAIPKYGSVEFRGMRGLDNWNIAVEWINILDSIKNYSLGYNSPVEIISQFSYLGYRDFIRRVLPDHWRMFVDKTRVYERIMADMRLAQELAYCIEWKDDPVKANVKREGEMKKPPKKIKPLMMEPAPVRVRMPNDWMRRVAMAPMPPRPPEPAAQAAPLELNGHRYVFNPNNLNWEMIN